MKNCYVIAVISVLLVLCFAANAAALEPAKAPKRSVSTGDPNPATGFVPPDFDLPHLNGSTIPDSLRSPQVITRFDWRESGKVSSVKNQGACGACYAFASLADLESKVLIDSSQTFDFSENNVKECEFYGSSCSGGNAWKTTNHYTQQGVVLESCDAYVASDVACNGTCSYVKNVLDWRVVSSSAMPATQDLKDYLYAHGPLYTTVFAGDASDPSWQSEFNAYDGSYALHHPGTFTSNHAVLLVGWDDTLSHAGGQGAWIVKNSWGTGWGGTCGYGAESGYFYIAYGSASIGTYSSFMYDWQDVDPVGDLYYYDDGGYGNSWGFASYTYGHLLAIYVPSSNGFLHRVEFWTNDVTTDIDVYVYDSFDGVDVGSLLASKLDQSFTEAGYHSVELDSPLPITSGDDIAIMVKIQNSSYGYPLISSGGGALESGKTYIGLTGTSGDWTDMANYSEDAAIRARCSQSLVVSADDGLNDEIKPSDFVLGNNYPNPFNPRTQIGYSIGAESHVTVAVYNILGQHISTIVDEMKEAGEYTVEWDATDDAGEPVSTGIYFYRIQAGDFSDTKKMLLLR